MANMCYSEHVVVCRVYFSISPLYVLSTSSVKIMTTHTRMHESNFLRSEDMSLVQLYIPSELAHAVVSELGELGQIQFRDMNPEINNFQRTFVGEIRRLDDMDRKIRFLRVQCDKAGIFMRPSAALNGVVVHRPRTVQELDELQSRLVEVEKRLVQMNASQEVLNKRYFELTEMRHVLRETAYFFEEVNELK